MGLGLGLSFFLSAGGAGSSSAILLDSTGAALTDSTAAVLVLG